MVVEAGASTDAKPGSPKENLDRPPQLRSTGAFANPLILLRANFAGAVILPPVLPHHGVPYSRMREYDLFFSLRASGGLPFGLPNAGSANGR